MPGNYNLRIHHDDPLAQRKREWLVEHWGALTALAGRCRVTPQMVREESVLERGNYEGVGLEVQLKDGHLVIVAPMDGSPAQRAGLNPGDVIMTGTPGGVGWTLKPPVFLRQGDVVEIDIEGIGVLRNPVVAEKLQTPTP